MTSVCLFVLIFSALRAEISWEEYKVKYELNFENEEESLRKQIFEENVKKIEAENAMGYSYKLGINHFAHWTKEELKSIFMTPKHHNDVEDEEISIEESSGDDQETPSEDVNRYYVYVDWRQRNVVTKVKNQYKCGACYAFATTANLESARAMKTKVLEDLSPQQIIDCGVNNGCNGGSALSSYQYLKTFGAMAWTSYPYTAKKDICRHKQSAVVAKVRYYTPIYGGKDTNLVNSVTKRPTTVEIRSNFHAFIYYRSGIFDNKECDSKEPDHMAIVVGAAFSLYKKYYILKNSWGDDWGMNGYMHLSAYRKNPCGVASTPSYVVMA